MPTEDEAQMLVNLARSTAAEGSPLLHLQLNVSALNGAESSWGSSENVVAPDWSVGRLLNDVEATGWRLEHTGYAFVETGSSTSQRMMSSGYGQVNRGSVVGYFTFRRA